MPSGTLFDCVPAVHPRPFYAQPIALSISLCAVQGVVAPVNDLCECQDCTGEFLSGLFGGLIPGRDFQANALQPLGREGQLIKSFLPLLVAGGAIPSWSLPC